jgi:hypothetical protein
MTKPSDIETPPTPLQRENDRQLARCYAIHGVLAGGFLFFWVGIATQAARTSMEGDLMFAATLLQPVPMFITAAALWYGLPWARGVSICLPLLIAVCCIPRLFLLFGPNVEWDHDPFLIIGDLQMVNIPGAIIFAIVTACNMHLEAKAGRPPDH